MHGVLLRNFLNKSITLEDETLLVKEGECGRENRYPLFMES